MKTMEEGVEGCSLIYNTSKGGKRGMLELRDGDYNE
jgi:hypothetical protein